MGCKKLIGVDINADAIEICDQNMKLNEINNYELYNSKVQDLNLDKVDVVVCNPPYFKNGKVNVNTCLANARHEEELTLGELIFHSKRLLKDNGKLMLVYKSCDVIEVIKLMDEYKFGVNRIQFVYDSNKDNSTCVLIEGIKNKNKYKKAVRNYKYNNEKIIHKWNNEFNNRNKKFSIIIPNYNKAPYIKECLDSVMNQTFKNYEVIFIDDCSTDNSLEIANSYKNVTVLKTKRNSQAGGARNLGMKKAKGEYIVFLDSDDYFTDKYSLEKLVNHITDEDLIFINYTKNNFGIITEMREPKTSMAKKIETTKNLGCPTKVFKRKLIKE